MNPIAFTAKETHNSAPAVLAESVLDRGRVRSFGSVNEVPRIAEANVEKRTADVIGTRSPRNSNHIAIPPGNRPWPLLFPDRPRDERPLPNPGPTRKMRANEKPVAFFPTYFGS